MTRIACDIGINDLLLLLVQVCLVVAANNVQGGGAGAIGPFRNATEERREDKNLKCLSDILVWDTADQNEGR